MMKNAILLGIVVLICGFTGARAESPRPEPTLFSCEIRSSATGGHRLGDATFIRVTPAHDAAPKKYEVATKVVYPGAKARVVDVAEETSAGSVVKFEKYGASVLSFGDHVVLWNDSEIGLCRPIESL